MSDSVLDDEVDEMRRCGFSDSSILSIYALSRFLNAFDAVQRAWLEQCGSLGESLEQLSLARLLIKKTSDPGTVAPPGQTGVQFCAGLFKLVEEAWHLCRSGRSFPPNANLPDADSKRLLNDMLSRPPVIREELRKAWLHLKHVALLEARDARIASGGSDPPTATASDKASRGQQPTRANGSSLKTGLPPAGWHPTPLCGTLKKLAEWENTSTVTLKAHARKGISWQIGPWGGKDDETGWLTPFAIYYPGIEKFGTANRRRLIDVKKRLAEIEKKKQQVITSNQKKSKADRPKAKRK